MARYHVGKRIMEIRRFFVDKNQIDGEIITISSNEFLHLTKVLRHKVGYKIVVSNDCDDIDYCAEIIEISNDVCYAKVIEKTQNLTSTRCTFDLYQALPKGDKLDLIVQKSVELGINKVFPFASANVAETKCNIERLNRIALEASKQCGRARLAKVCDLIDFDELKSCLNSNRYDLILLPSEHEQSRNLDDMDTANAQRVAIIIGSEGGFKKQEVDELVAIASASPITLGNRILRCETAAIVTIALATYKLKEMQK